MVGMDLAKLVDNRMKACFLSKWHSLEEVLFWALSRGIQLPEDIEQSDIKSLEQNTNCTWTGISTQWAYDVTSIRTYTYEHSRHGIPWQLSACINSVYQALFLLPLRAWEQGYSTSSSALEICKPSSKVGIAELCCHNYTVGSYLFEHAGTSFVRENRIFHQFMKSFLPQKFPTIQYISLF